MVSDFTPWFPDIAKITALDAPHRIADAIFRESLLNGIYFRDSDRGQRFVAARAANATVLLELCPTALVFGVWDSTGLGPRAGSGAKFQRALVSEIVGIESETGIRTASRLDPLPISAQVDIYASPGGEGWTSDPGKALQEKNKAVPFRGQEGRGRPSSLNLGNVTPDVARDRRGDPLPGGVTIRYALQTTVLSLGALRRLGFPPAEGIRSERADVAARTLLAALALARVAYQREEGYDLRSRCLLVPVEAPCVQLVPGDGQAPVSYSLSAEQARDAFAQAANEAKAAGLPWSEEEIVLQPSERLITLIQRSLEVGSPLEGEGSAAEEAE